MDPVRQRGLQLLIAGTAAVVGALYALIAFGIIQVVEGQGSDAVPPMVIAAVMFLVLALLALTRPRRPLWVAGAALQILVLVGYVAIAAERTPAYEPWGVTVKVLQLGLLGGCTYLAIRGAAAPVSGQAGPGRPRRPGSPLAGRSARRRAA